MRLSETSILPEKESYPKEGFSGFNSCCDYVEIDQKNMIIDDLSDKRIEDYCQLSKSKLVEILHSTCGNGHVESGALVEAICSAFNRGEILERKK